MENQKEVSWVQENRIDDEETFKENKVKSILCNKIFKGWIFLTVFAVSVPILMYYFIIDQGTYKNNDYYTCLVQTTFRIPCGYINITSNECNELQCCYDRSTDVCYHYLPSKYSYDIDKEAYVYIASQSKTPFGTATHKQLRITVDEKNENKVSVILSQGNMNIPERRLNSDKNYKVNVVQEKLIVEIYRSNNDILLTTAKGPLIASDNYWEWSLYLTNHTLFGLDKTVIDVKINSTFTKVIYQNKVDHSTLPILWAYSNKNFHGVVIKHDGPLEITVLPSNVVILKSLTGGVVEVELSVGPTPKLLHDQLTQTAILPPFWALDTHMCRKGSNVNITELLADYIDNQANSNCIHENLVVGIMKDNKENTEQVRTIVKNMKERGSHFLLYVPPHLVQRFDELYNKSVEMGILYTYNNSIYEGLYLNEIVVYPNYNHKDIQLYIKEFFSLISTYIDINDIDGIVLYDNWPLNEDYYMNNTDFPYFSEELEEAMSYTLPWNSTVSDGIYHIESHNSYGTSQILSFQNYYDVIGQDIYIMSTSKSFGQPEPTVIQNINASWVDLKMQIDNLLFNSISGNHLVSLPVCGDTIFFSDVLQDVLCLRWYLVAATMPVLTISSHEPWREPHNLNSIFAQGVALNTLNLRNMLLPYYYTILRANEPIIRPMFYNYYYENETTFSLENQYMIGDNIIVVHPFSTGRSTVQIYLPKSVGIWYELWGGQLYNSTEDPWINFDIVATDFIAFMSHGNILPLKDENTLNLIIGLDCSAESCVANGTLFDNGSDMIFVSNKTVLTISDIPQNACNYTLGYIKLYFYENRNAIEKHFTQDEDLCNGDDVNTTVIFNIV